jgi:hypothetical protein
MFDWLCVGRVDVTTDDLGGLCTVCDMRDGVDEEIVREVDDCVC